MFNRLFTLFLLMAISGLGVAQCDSSLPKPQRNYLFNLRVDEAQEQADLLDHKKDCFLKLDKNEEINLHSTYAIFHKVDDLQLWIDSTAKFKNDNERIGILRQLKDMLNSFIFFSRHRQFPPVYIPELIDNFRIALMLDIDSLDISPLIQGLSYESGWIISDIFHRNKGFASCRKILFLKYSTLNPENILREMEPYCNEYFADSLITLACLNNPVQFYNYAQDTNSCIGKRILSSTNLMVQAVAGLSRIEHGSLLYFPFLDDIISGKQKIDSLKNIIGDGEAGYDSVAYFKLLVKTEIDYTRRIFLNRQDTPIAMFGANGLRDMLRRKAIAHFITSINELHEKPENIRMKAVESLSPTELYYMIVLGENDIFTSSYKYSFARLVQRMGRHPRGDSMLLNIRFDFFKKFLKMAASYNRLDTFLRLMPTANSEALMQAFVSGLEKTTNLEDAVDVADSYSSITNKQLLNNILEYISENEVKAEAREDERGQTIYGLLKIIFMSADSSNNIDLTKITGISSIFKVENSQLADDSGRIIEQVFFYGDADGKTYFPAFVNSFSPKEWKIDRSSKEWVEIKSLKGKKVWIYANLPLDYERNLDDSAQAHLNNYLAKNGLLPTIVIHRGHSYWLPGTLERMPSDTKIIVLGSCGGYKNLNKIIEQNPDAHIISTKEIGAGDINRPVSNYLHMALLSGKTIDWRDMWKTLTKTFNSDPNKNIRESWESYIPPYRNMGSIFLKAYYRKTEGN